MERAKRKRQPGTLRPAGAVCVCVWVCKPRERSVIWPITYEFLHNPDEPFTITGRAGSCESAFPPPAGDAHGRLCPCWLTEGINQQVPAARSLSAFPLRSRLSVHHQEGIRGFLEAPPRPFLPSFYKAGPQCLEFFVSGLWKRTPDGEGELSSGEG